KHGRPPAGVCPARDSLRQQPPIFSRTLVVLCVIAVIEEDQIVKTPVVTDCPPRVFVAPLEIAKPEPQEIARQINAQSESRDLDQERAPKRQHKSELNRHQRLKSRLSPHSCVMRQVPLTPERLRQSEQQAEI